MQDQGTYVNDEEGPINNSFSSPQHIHILRMLTEVLDTQSTLMDSVGFTSSSKKYSQTKDTEAISEYYTHLKC